MIISPDSTHEALLSSIISTDLRKITIPTRQMYNWRIFLSLMELWGSIDKQLCDLVDRLRATGYHHTLEVELCFTLCEGYPNEDDFTKFLPGFREKGTVTVICATRDDQAIHRST